MLTVLFYVNLFLCVFLITWQTANWLAALVCGVIAYGIFQVIKLGKAIKI